MSESRPWQCDYVSSRPDSYTTLQVFRARRTNVVSTQETMNEETSDLGIRRGGDLDKQ
jgi:hypothetical protein